MADKHSVLFIGRGQAYEDLKPRVQPLKDIDLLHQDSATVDEMKSGHTDILIIEYAGTHEATWTILDDVGPKHQDSLMILFTPQKPEPDKLVQYMHYGIRDIITPDDNPEAILRNAIGLIGRRSEAQASSSARLGKVLSFFSAKGGVGKTFLSVSSARIFGRSPDHKTVMMDLDLQFGDMDLYLDANSTHTLGELVEEIKNNGDRLSDFVLDTHIHQIAPNLHLLSAPLSPDKADIITGAHIAQIIKVLKKRYDFVVLDAGGVLNEITLSAFDKSDRIFLVANDEIASIKTAGQTYQLLKQLNYPENKVDYIVNAASKQFPLDDASLLKLLTRAPFIRIPASAGVRESFNGAYSLVDKKQNDPAAKGVLQFTEKLAKEWSVQLTPQAGKKESGGMMSKLMGKKA